MYLSPSNKLTDANVIADFINEYSFGLVVSPSLEATHLPLLYKVEPGTKGYLLGHFAKANGQWQALDGQRVLVIFNGPHSYISPTHYAVKPAVPTWNYAVVHCFGRVELVELQENAEIIDELVAKYEPELLRDNTMIPAEFKQQLLSAVVGFKIVIDDIQAKEKLGQHRSDADQQGVYQALCESESPQAQMLAGYMRKRKLGTGQK